MAPARDNSIRYSRRGRGIARTLDGGSAWAARLQLPVDPHTLPPVTTRLRALSEAEAYARCYGNAGEDVKVVRVPRRPRYQLEVSGEDLRAAFAERLDKREPELAEGLERAAADEQSVGALDAPAAPFASPEMPFESPSMPFASPSFEASEAPSEPAPAEPANDVEAA
jgi:hypothetical protein